EPGTGGHAIRTVPEIDAVEIAREDFILAELRIEPHCRQRFAELVQQGALMPEKAYLHELLGNRAAAFHDYPGTDIAAQCPENPLGIEARMVEKVPILDADNGLHKVVGKIGSRSVGQLERAYASERLAIRRFEDE